MSGFGDQAGDAFAFNPEEKWEVSTSTLLPVGNHVVTIDDVDVSQKSKGGYPQAIVRMSNVQGEITDWIVISSPKTFGKFTALVLAAGFDQADWPQPGEDFSTEDGAIQPGYARKLVGRKVGVVVREEADNRQTFDSSAFSGSPGEVKAPVMRLHVKGYVPASELAGKQSDVTQSGEGQDFAQAAAQPSGAAFGNDDLPFAPSIY